MRRRPRKAWILGTVFAGFLGLSNALGVALLALNRRWLEGVTGLLSVLAAYWIAMGAWRRTPWGAPSASDLPAPPTILSARRARIYIVVSVACVVAAAVAVALQVLVFSR